LTTQRKYWECELLGYFVFGDAKIVDECYLYGFMGMFSSLQGDPKKLFVNLCFPSDSLRDGYMFWGEGETFLRFD
jgi:hypothetical protein